MLCAEFYVFGCTFVWVVPNINKEGGYDLHIIPTNWVVGKTNSTAYGPSTIKVKSSGSSETVEIPSTEFVQFRTYSPGNPGGYISPISALRQTLYEQVESGRFRRQLWRSSGRLNAQIVRPKDVAPWNDEQKKKFATAFREAWSGEGSKAGSIPLLEDGMEIKPFNTSFKEYEWAQSVTLSREAVAAAYRINPSLVWHSNTQTYASAKDNARALYAECLGPDIVMIQQRINAFLLLFSFNSVAETMGVPSARLCWLGGPQLMRRCLGEGLGRTEGKGCAICLFFKIQSVCLSLKWKYT